MDALFWELRRTCALGRVLELGCGTGQFVQRLVEHGVQAFGVDRDEAAIREAETYVRGRFRHMSGSTTLPIADNDFETVVCLDWLSSVSEADIDHLIVELRRVASRHLFIRVDSAPRAARNREWWDARFLRAGFRRHPLLFSVVDYSALDRESGAILLLYERIADAGLNEYPLTRLAVERDLHMDMLREAGRRSDAHLQRYAAAAALVRPNDVVLDAACGLGYGIAMLAAAGRASRIIGIDNSQYAIDYAQTMYGTTAADVELHVDDVHELDGIPDHSVDLVISFETVEHLQDPQRFLKNVTRILTPGGRFIGSVPNEWLDETGRDPNPHHLHVFDAKRFLALFEAPFLVEHLIAETAGGGMKALTDPIRGWRTVDPREASQQSAEWWVVVAMKDPRVGSGVPYFETVHAVPPDSHRPASIAYADAYENPWLRNALVTQGVRISDQQLLATIARDVEEQAPDGSVDQGAALCVQGHQLLSRAQADHEEVALVITCIERWMLHDDQSPHHFRWRVSLESLAAKLCLFSGRRADALQWFERCAGRDALEFSPLLATKTVEAAFMAGLLRAWDRDEARACSWWQTGLRQAGQACRGEWREIIGDPDQPLTFGLRELGQVIDHASRCAAGINALANWKSAPARLAELLLAGSVADRQRVTELMTARRVRRLEAEVAAARSAPPAQLIEMKSVARLRDDLRESTERLKQLRAALSGRASQPPRRIVIADADEAGRRLWEALAPLGTVEIVGFIDVDVRRQGRSLLGAEVHPPQWLETASVDLVAISEGRAAEWQFVLAKAGVQSRQTFELPTDDRDPSVAANAAASMFPDPLAGVLASVPSALGLRVGIFGTGAAGMKVWEVLAGMDTADAVWFADNNPRQQGTMILGLKVISPDEIADSDVDVIVVGSMSRDPIRKQLLALGVRPDAVLTPVVTAPLDELRREISNALLAVTLERVS